MMERQNFFRFSLNQLVLRAPQLSRIMLGQQTGTKVNFVLNSPYFYSGLAVGSAPDWPV